MNIFCEIWKIKIEWKEIKNIEKIIKGKNNNQIELKKRILILKNRLKIGIWKIRKIFSLIKSWKENG